MPEEEPLPSSVSLSIRPFEAARLSMLKLGLCPSDEIERSMTAITQISADTMQVARVGVWFFENDELLRSAYLFDRRSQQTSSGERFVLADCPAYHQAIRTRRAVAVRDAQNDPKTSEMRESYLTPQGITSMLDAPIYVDGKVCGIVCHEHVGPMRAWSQADIDFASSVADVISSLCQQARREKVEREMQALRDELARTERMHALARLAAGVAHDLNNLLSVVLLNAGSLPPSPQARMIEDQCKLGARLARQLLGFARETPPEETRLDLREILQDMTLLLGSMLGDRVRLSVRPGEAPLWVQANQGEIEQIFLNLAGNARDAMPTGGSFAVEAAPTEREVVLVVSDTGAGMAPEVLRRAFEPFFTTRRDSGGTGMGLAVVYGAMKRARGSVEVESEPGQGTRFTLRWPRSG